MTTAQINYIDGVRLHRGLTAGMYQVLEQQNYLNKINVFPVPDGDTGTNLCYTLQSIMEDSHSKVQPHAGETAEAIADAALDGARGNSGVILAQFFQGFSESCARHDRLNVHHLADAMQAGYHSATEALAEPREGTILSVIKASAESLFERTKAGTHDIHEALAHSLKKAEEALARTPDQLAILKKRGVVDAGGQGFVYILKGITDFIADGSIRQHLKINEQFAAPEILSEEDIAEEISINEKYRYCTECLITGEKLVPKEIRTVFSTMGDSLVVGGSHKRVKVHVHTDKPQNIFDIATGFGDLSGQKVDDMIRQMASTRLTRDRVAVVVDSTADIPPEIVEKYDIHMVPVLLNFGATSYLDKITITPKEFLKQLTTNPIPPTSSQPKPGDFIRLYQFLASHYKSVVSIHIPPAVSGTYQSAETAARRQPDTKITLLDGANTAVGLGMVVVHAAKAAMEGKSHEEVVAAANRAIENTTIFAAIQDLSWTVRGGRVSAKRKFVADLLRATPVLTVTDKHTIDTAGIFFGKKNLPKGLAKFTAKRHDLDQTYTAYISHALNEEGAEQLAKELPLAGFKINEYTITDTGAALGAHAGPGSLILALQHEDL